VRNSDIVTSVLVLAIVLIFAAQLRGITFFGLVFPQAVLWGLGLCAGALLVIALVRRQASKQDIEAPQLGTVTVALLLMVAWIALMERLGFYVTSVLVFGLEMLLIDPAARNVKSFIRSLVGVAIELAVFYIAFSTMLEVPLPRGILF
jgi:hypothetical protein